MLVLPALVDLPPDCWTMALSSWDKWDPLTFRGERSESVVGWTDPIRWSLSLNITNRCGRKWPQSVAAFHRGCIVSLTNVVFSMSHPCCVPLSTALSFPCVFIDRAYLPWGALAFRLPSIDISSSGVPCLCVLGWTVCRALGPCLFYLVWSVVMLRNIRLQVEALLCKWALFFIFIRVQK